MSPCVADATPPPLGDSFPYLASITTTEGAPFEGIFDVAVQVFEGSGGSEVLAYEEVHVAVEIVEGDLSLSLGEGQSWNFSSLSSVLEHGGPYSIRLLVDGEPLGELAPLGSVPVAAIGLRVPSEGVMYGGPHGQIPAEAVEPTVRVLQGFYLHGDEIAVPDGWTCEHVASVDDTSAALAMGTNGIHGQDLFIASVGPAPVHVLPGLSIDFSFLPESPGVVVGDSKVQLRHAWTMCSSMNWDTTCDWD
ncbi:MAG: hypothetical protein ACPHRO_02450, partial [Nannocystaceae bacterium]